MLPEDWRKEQLLTLPQAAALLGEKGVRGSVTQLHHYIHRGAKAADGEYVRLESIRVGAGIYTSLEALDRWVRRLSPPADPQTEPTPAEMMKRSQEARERVRKAYGI